MDRIHQKQFQVTTDQVIPDIQYIPDIYWGCAITHGNKLRNSEITGRTTIYMETRQTYRTRQNKTPN